MTIYPGLYRCARGSPRRCCRGWVSGRLWRSGFLPPDDDVEDVLVGYAIGIEGTADAGDATLFGRVGYAPSGSDE